MNSPLARISLSPLVVLLLGLITNTGHAWVMIDFEDDPLPPETARPADSGDQSPYISQDVVFNRSWNTDFDCCPSGWAVSNQTDQVTPGAANSYSAFVSSTNGGGRDSSQFAVANNFQQGESRITFPQPAQVQGMYLTNTTYTYLATVAGDDGAGFVKGPFAAGDWLRLDVIGLDGDANETGRQSIYLVDYRNGLSDALDEWTWVDLEGLGTQVSSLQFAMESTDSGPFGMNTPAYFAIDDLSFRVVPEPSSGVLAVVALSSVLGFGRRRTIDVGR